MRPTRFEDLQSAAYEVLTSEQYDELMEEYEERRNV